MPAVPIIDGRDRSAILADLLARVPGYVPEWSTIEATPAYALLSILARDIEIQAAAENGMPDRARLAFLSALGNSLLPAQAAGTPLVFQLMANAPQDVTLIAGSQIAAKLPPPPPSLLGNATKTSDPPLFSTDTTITLTRAALTTVYSVDPDADTYADHSAALTSGFRFFDAMTPVPHQLYLGHDEMFRLPGSAEIQLSFDLAAAFAKSIPRPLLLDWEYLSADGWLPLRIGDDQTARLTRDGRVVLWLDFGPDAKQEKVGGINSYWIRGTVSARIPSGKVGPLPGGYKITWGPSPTLPVAPSVLDVTVDGTHHARIVAVSQSTVTLDWSLPFARAGAALNTFPGGTFVGRIVRSVGGQSLILDGVDPGRRITVQGTSISATVLDGDGDVAVLDQLLAGITIPKNAPPPPLPVLVDAESGEVVGTLLSIDAAFTVPLDSGAEFLAGDVVTVDGSTQATVKVAGGRGVTLSGPIGNAVLGNQLALANSLPVLRPEGADTSGVLPSIDTIFARVGFTKSDLLPDAAYCDSAPLDISNAFYPFGKLPQKFTTFYIASAEVFQRQNAQVTMTFLLGQAGKGFDDNDQPGVVDVSIEYFDGDVWQALGPAQSLLDQTVSLTVGDRTHPTTISFICPANWASTKVGGQSNHWLRMRIDDGNYGHPLRLSVDPGPPPVVTSDPATLTPPVVASIRLRYTFLTNAGLVQHCLAYNDFVFTDHSEDVQWPRRTFKPFTPVGDNQPAIHFGFSHALPSGLVSMYFAADPAGGVTAPTSSPFVWEYASPRGWVGLPALDATDGFSGSGLVQLIGPSDAEPLVGLGGSLYWLRARLKPDIPPAALPGLGLWMNAVEAHQGQSVLNDTLGSSDGNPGQTFAFAPQHVPVLPGEIIQVREWTGRGDDWQTAVQGVAETDLTREVDPSDGKTVIAVWVTWHLVPYFYQSEPSDRHYMLERATGLLQFPTPPYGMIPPAGALVTASYATGGGLAGNVPAGTITELHSSASYVQSVVNPFPASGGSATEAVSVARDRATQRIRHRDRAVAPADFEWIAREASPQVARARCLSTTGPDGTRELGWVTLVVVPNSTDAAPLPTSGLLDEVRTALVARVPAAIAGSILLQPPNYTALTVRADIVPLRPDQAAIVEARVRARLATFLHPLTGGVDGAGWGFGQPVYQSQLASLLETTEGVDYVALLQLVVNDGVTGDSAQIAPDSLVCQGDTSFGS
jgi:hypothetical protein